MHNGTDIGVFVLGMHRSGTSAIARAVSLLGFSLGDRPTRNDGRYVRELQLFVSDEVYAPRSRTHLCQTNLFFSNKGTITYGFDAELRARLVLFEVDDPKGTFTPVVDRSELGPKTTEFASPFSVNMTIPGRTEAAGMNGSALRPSAAARRARSAIGCRPRSEGCRKGSRRGRLRMRPIRRCTTCRRPGPRRCSATRKKRSSRRI